MTGTVGLLKQVAKRLTKNGSLILIAVSTGSAIRLIQALNEHFPRRWRVMPTTPVAAPWVKEDDERAVKLLSGRRHLEPFVWRQGDGWVWRLTWVIEASMEADSFPFTRGLPLQPYGYEVANDLCLAAQIDKARAARVYLDADKLL
jgi:hypothetical protein